MADVNGFQLPSAAQLIARARQDLLKRSDQIEPLRRNDLEVKAHAIGGAALGLYSFMEYMNRQMFAETADTDWLPRHGNPLGIYRKDAAFATGTITITGTIGAAVVLNAVLQDLDGLEYKVTSSHTLTTTTQVVSVEALATGAAYNQTAGEVLSFVNPQAGLQSDAVVIDVSGGADIEDGEDWRARIIERKRQPPHGGAGFDYVEWAKKVPGVTRAWVHPHMMGKGTVGVRFVMDGRADYFPLEEDIATVKAYIETVRPVTAKGLYVVAPSEKLIAHTIKLNPDTPENRASVMAELEDFYRREARPNQDDDTPDVGQTIKYSRISETISIAAGEFSHELTVPAADVVNEVGEMAALGVITWSAG